jgi:hypothetical protein
MGYSRKLLQQKAIYVYAKDVMKSWIARSMEMNRKWVKEFGLGSSVGKPQGTRQLERSRFILCYGFHRKRVQVSRSESSANAA